jgi:oligopeptide/dipeptide ABC transporter ATP-binding protein
MTEDIPLVEINDLGVEFRLREGVVRAVDGVSLHVRKGEVLGIVGESGSGKSISVRSIMQLLPKTAVLSRGSVVFRPPGGGEIDIAKLDRKGREIRSLRGRHIGMIFQEPMTALSPVHTIGHQVMTPVRLHLGLGKKAARDRARELLQLVQMPRPDQMLDAYPHELSGGMRQRAMIAIALACNPSLLIADEPTTALDVTTEAQILDLLKSLQQRLGMAIIFITHNFGVVADIADRIAVMYMGRVVESGPVDDIFESPQHPYTRALMASVPRLGAERRRRLTTIPGMVPDPFELPKGCSFHTRCSEAVAGTCDRLDAPLINLADGRNVRCHLHSQNQTGGPNAG